MSTALRYDRAPMRKATRDKAGFLRGEALIARTGVQEYRNADGSIRRELRLPEEVFSADSLASLKMAPMTRGHPMENGAHVAVTAENAKKYTVGSIGESIDREVDAIRASYIVTDGNAISDVEAGRARELSAGYSQSLEFKSGVYDGQPYDAIQRNIRYNHVAILERGRAGSHIAIRLDSLDAISVDGEDEMTIKIKVDGVDVEFATEQSAQIVKLAFDKQEAAIVASKTEIEKQTARADGLAVELKKAKDASTDAAIQQRVDSRVSLIQRASLVDSEMKFDGLTDHEVRLAVVKQAAPDEDFAKRSDAYVEGRFDSIVEMIENADEDDVDVVEKTDEKRETATIARNLVRAAAASINTDGKQNAPRTYADAHREQIERQSKIGLTPIKPD